MTNNHCWKQLSCYITKRYISHVAMVGFCFHQSIDCLIQLTILFTAHRYSQTTKYWLVQITQHALLHYQFIYWHFSQTSNFITLVWMHRRCDIACRLLLLASCFAVNTTNIILLTSCVFWLTLKVCLSGFINLNLVSVSANIAVLDLSGNILAGYTELCNYPGVTLLL